MCADAIVTAGADDWDVFVGVNSACARLMPAALSKP